MTHHYSAQKLHIYFWFASLVFGAFVKPTLSQQALKDGDFVVSVPTNASGFKTFPNGSTIGAWRVSAGNVDFLQQGKPLLMDKTYSANAIDLDGSTTGSISQTFETRIGNTYTVTLAYSGDFNTSDETKVLKVQAGSATQTVSFAKPFGWSPSKMMWKTLTFDFKASASSTTIELKSVAAAAPSGKGKKKEKKKKGDEESDTSGPIITNVKVFGQAPPALNTVRVPLPNDLDKFVKDRSKAILLGKALFWDMQVGSDGRTACATCHASAGTDHRTVNTLAPGAPGSTFGPQLPGQQALREQAIDNFRGTNYKLVASDFPFHKVADPTGDHDGNKVLRDTMEIVGSQGVVKRNFVKINPGNPIDHGTLARDDIFQLNGVNSRQVSERNSPTMINAVFLDRNFWDGRANHYFNGVNPFGDLDPNAKVLRRVISTRVVSDDFTKVPVIAVAAVQGKAKDKDKDKGKEKEKEKKGKEKEKKEKEKPTPEVIKEDRLVPTKILLNNASLASQAVGPALSRVEMSWDGRQFMELGRKMFSLTPLALQEVHPNDGVLGSLANVGGKGLKNVSYSQLVREAFHDEWWSSPESADGFTHMEANFSLFWGLAIMMYESTLVSDQTPYDSYASGNKSALNESARRGLKLFLDEGKCINCHGGPEFAGATIGEVRGNGQTPELIEFMEMAKGEAFYDGGFYNIGVRKTLEDLAVGASHPQFGPLSYSARRRAGKDVGQNINVPPSARLAINGAFKAPTMRNIELTGPYFHNGGTRTLRESVEFYVRGADFFHENINDLDPDVNGIQELQGNPQGINDLVEFLKSLTDERVRFQRAPFDHPELVIPNGHSGVNNGVPIDKNIVIPAVGASGGYKILPFEEIVR